MLLKKNNKINKLGEWRTKKAVDKHKKVKPPPKLMSLSTETTHLAGGVIWGVSVASCVLLCLTE